MSVESMHAKHSFSYISSASKPLFRFVQYNSDIHGNSSIVCLGELVKELGSSVKYPRENISIGLARIDVFR